MKINASRVACALVIMAAAGCVLAGQGGSEFDDVWSTLVDWTQGTLGRIIAIAMVLVGLVAGVTRNSIMGLVVGIAAGMGLYNAPTVIESIMGAASVGADKAPLVMMLSNGLF